MRGAMLPVHICGPTAEITVYADKIVRTKDLGQPIGTTIRLSADAITELRSWVCPELAEMRAQHAEMCAELRSYRQRLALLLNQLGEPIE